MKGLTLDPKKTGTDFDTVQRTIQSMEGLIASMRARITELETVTTPPPPIIAPNGHVTVFQQRNGDVVQGFGGGFTGLSVGSNSGLSGAGTSDSPLTTVVDGATVTLVGNTLTGYFYKLDYPNIPFTGLATTPLTLVAGVTGKVIIPLIVGTESTIAAGTAWTNGNTAAKLVIDVAANSILALPTWALASGLNTRFYLTSGVSWNTAAGVTAAQHFTGKALKLSTTADIANPGGAAAATVNLSLVYYLAGLTLFS